MKLFNTRAPWVFRMYVFIYGLIGIYLLGLLVFKTTKNESLGLFFSAFVITCPVLTYYLAGFIPTITSLSSFFIGIFFYFSYLQKGQKKQILISVLFLTLAGLARKPFSIFLIALLINEIIRSFSNKKLTILSISSVLTGLLFIALYSIYNSRLGILYGSGFLNQLLPPESLSQFIYILKETFLKWTFHYFTILHYVVLIWCIWVLVKRLKQKLATEYQKEMLIFISICFAGAAFYSILMAKQFIDHDYYFYDSFFPVIVLIVFSGFIQIQKTDLINYNSSKYFLIFFTIGFVILSFLTQTKRRETGHWDRVEITRQNFTGSEQFLDQAGIPKTSKMLVIDANTTNAPLILMNRKGYTLLTTSAEKIKKALEWNYDFVVMQDEYIIPEVITEYPQIIEQLTRVAGNGKISVYRKEQQENTLESFLGISEKEYLFSSSLTFDIIPQKHWTNIQTEIIDTTKKMVGVVTPDNEFAATFALANSSWMLNNNLSVYFSGNFNSLQKNNSCKLVFSLVENNKLVMYKSFDLHKWAKDPVECYEISTLFPIPVLKNNNFEFKAYIWNPSKEKCFYENLKLSIYKNPECSILE